MAKTEAQKGSRRREEADKRANCARNPPPLAGGYRVPAITWYVLGALSLVIGTAPAAGAAHTEATATNEDRVSYLDNGVIRLGVNLELGGAITYLSTSKSRTNLINSYDWGR